MSHSFIFSLRVYGEDTDGFGIVHHPNYLKYMERARCEWVISLGYSLEQWAREGILFVIHKAELHYLQPLRAYEYIEIVSRIVKQRTVGVTYEQIIRSHIDPEKIYCKGLISVVCVDKNIQPRVFPLELLDSAPVKLL